LTKSRWTNQTFLLVHDMQFDHPNAKGVLMPGQTRCHKGKLVPRGTVVVGTGDADETPLCTVLCSPVGQFPPPVNRKGTVHKTKPAATKDGKKENVSANLPMEASVDKLL
jgi:hypothetical protein